MWHGVLLRLRRCPPASRSSPRSPLPDLFPIVCRRGEGLTGDRERTVCNLETRLMFPSIVPESTKGDDEVYANTSASIRSRTWCRSTPMRRRASPFRPGPIPATHAASPAADPRTRSLVCCHTYSWRGREGPNLESRVRRTPAARGGRCFADILSTTGSGGRTGRSVSGIAPRCRSARSERHRSRPCFSTPTFAPRFHTRGRSASQE